MSAGLVRPWDGLYVRGRYSFRRSCSSLSLRYSSSSAAARHFFRKTPAALLFIGSRSSLGRLLSPPLYFAYRRLLVHPIWRYFLATSIPTKSPSERYSRNFW